MAVSDKPFEPGVYEDEIHPPGEHWYKILMPSGAVGTVHFPDELWDEEVVRQLWKRYWAKTRSTHTPLAIIR